MPNLGESRRAYRACGKDPGRGECRPKPCTGASVRDGTCTASMPWWDVNNLVSLETGFSLGSYDRDRLEGSVVLRRGKPGESYPGIGKDSVNLECMPLLADEAGPVGSPPRAIPRGPW